MISKARTFKQTAFDRLNQRLKAVKMYQIMRSYFKQGAQLSFRSFCHLFILYAFGGLFIELDHDLFIRLDRTPNLLYEDLKHLNLLNTAYSTCCCGVISILSRTPDRYSNMDDHYIPVNVCALSSYGIKCLKVWHVFTEFNHFIKQLSKKNQALHYALAKPIKDRRLREILYGRELPPSYTLPLTKQLHKLWKNYNIRALDLVRGTNLKGVNDAVRDLCKVIAHRSMIRADCFLNTLKPVFKKQKLITKPYLHGFGIHFLDNVHTTYNSDNVDLLI